MNPRPRAGNAKVVRHAPCPVLVARTQRSVFQHVLCPVDFSASSRAAVDFAAQLVDPAGTLTLLHVIELPVSYDAHADITDFLRDLDTRSTRMLDELAAATRDRYPVLVKTAIRVGSAGAQTLAALDHHDPSFDLVVLGSHGRTGIKRVLLGSVAEKIVRHAPCSVVVTRARA